MQRDIQSIAIGILQFNAQILVGWRHAEQHQGNKYEFPGGKCEPNESPVAACRREVMEEVGVDVAAWRCLGHSEFDYGDVLLRLHWFQATLNASQATQIQTGWQWQSREQLLTLPFPKANRTVLTRLQWPRCLKISAALSDVAKVEQLMYWRPDPQQNQQQLLQQLLAFTESQLSRLMLNWALWQQLPQALQAKIHTVHLKHSQLMQLSAESLLPQLRYVAACHDAVSLAQAQRMGCDTVLLSPVQTTATHPYTTPLGWDGFAQMAADYALPIYALGGLSPHDLDTAQTHGAYGVAGISQF